MELEEITYLQLLHFAVEKFISHFKNCISFEVLSTQKAFREIVKRSESITQDLRSIVLHAKTSRENSDLYIPDVGELLDDKIQRLVHDILLQDFFELALNGEEHFSVSDDELHTFLYCGASKDVTDFRVSSLEMEGSFNFHTPLDASIGNNMQECSLHNFSSLPLSSQFKNARMQFEEELSELRRIEENGFSVSDLSRFNVATILKYESNDNTTETAMQNEHGSLQEPVVQNDFLHPSISVISDSDTGILSDIYEESDGFLSWESCLGKYLHDHSYISEVTPDAAVFNISEKEFQTYHSLVNPLDAISEDDMVHDILDLLIGIPSNTFFYDIHARKFVMKSGVHLPNISFECTSRIVAKFIESGSMYYALQNFSRDFLHANEGLVFRGMQHGIEQILTLYKEYIVAVKVNLPSMLFLRSDVLKNAELMQNLGVMCGIDPEKMIINEIPKGLGLLSYLHNIARSHKRKENGIMIAVILKFAYAPYFSYLNEWMTEGICNDPFGEFQIMEDYNYLERRDALYWKFAYTENIDDPIRVVPPEIKHFSQGILDCGKSIGLLKICCPELSSLKYFFLKPPPTLSMMFSFPAAICKLKECMEYIGLKENADLISESEISEVSDDVLYIEKQKLVNEKLMMKFIERRWNTMLASKITNSNILDFKKVSQYFKEYSMDNSDAAKSLNKCDCLPFSVTENRRNVKRNIFRTVGTLFSSSHLKCINENIFQMPAFKPVCLNNLRTENVEHFSGLIHKDTGILFSTCGYAESSMESYNISKDIEDNFSSLEQVNKQLQLFPDSQNSLSSIDSKCKQLFSQEIDLLDTFYNGNKKVNSTNYVRSDRKFSVKEEKVDEVPSGMACSSPFKEADQNFATNFYKKGNVQISFMDKLASLLVSEYGDSIDDIYSCIKVTSLQRLMMHNFNSVLRMRIHLIEKVIMKYIVKQLGLDTLLFNLRNVYFFQDGIFSQSLCEPLFSLVMKCRTPREFANWAVLNEILMNAISNSNNDDNPFLSTVNVNVAFVPDEMPVERTDFLHLFIIEFEVMWPLNIIIHQTCIQQYLKIFSTLLEIEFLCWLLGRIWRILITTCKELHLDDTPQFRDIMLKRFDMDQFVRVIRKSMHQHLRGLWTFLEKSLSGEESGIDDLESIHMQYLEKALARCFLTDETHVLHQLLSTMFHQIYKFCSAIFECEWERNNQNGHYETYTFKGLVAAFDTYKQYQKAFLKRVMKESLTKKCGRYWDKDYQKFLEAVSEIERYSNYCDMS